jgi:hypothetical protein
MNAEPPSLEQWITRAHAGAAVDVEGGPLPVVGSGSSQATDLAGVVA